MAGNVERDPRDIDRLIEDGLNRYGTGDLDGALLMWEQALALDPDNAQANSYVDYVRMNYELLTTELARNEDAPFAIGDDEPEYQIEIELGEAGEPSPPLHVDPLDEGWFIDAEPGARNGGLSRTASADFPQITLEIDEADTVSRLPRGLAQTEQEVSFDAATREYPSGKGVPSSDLLESAGDPITSEFRGEETPPFGELGDFQTPTGGWVTHVRKRDLGFVQPAGEPEQTPGIGPPELKMTLRTPAQSDPEPESDEPEIELGHAAPLEDDFELSYESDPAPGPAPGPARTLSSDLIASLPSPTPIGMKVAKPTPAHTAQTVQIPIMVAEAHVAQTVPIPVVPSPTQPLSNTRDLPGATRAPASPSEAPPSRSQTSDFEPQPTGDFSAQRTEKLPSTSVQLAKEQRDPPTAKVPAMSRPSAKRTSDPISPLMMVSAPTRDLGIRPPLRASSEDETTLHRERALEITLSDASPPEFDPVDTRTERILADVDAGVTGVESKEDRTRRRITTLFERAHAWQQSGDFERAVAAVDLALSEDPNSALAQKLIHRHRDIMTSVLAAFLGELERIPVLARPLHELANAPISPRAAFLLSRVDGILSLDEILDVSGMPRLEAMRYLCQLFLRGILR
jgi:hypothetical protein